MSHIMVDLETLGKMAGCQILSIGAVVFDRHGLGAEFYASLDTTRQHGLHVDPSTVEWWSKQSPEARKVFDEPTHEFRDGMKAFRDWLWGVDSKGKLEVWGNGSDFDNAILACAFHSADVDLPWLFWNNRCYRTLKNLSGAPKLDKTKRVGTYHNALDDAKTQAMHAIEIKAALGLWK